MQIIFDDNEFTSRELMEYLKTVYITQINGKPFTIQQISVWSKQMKVPAAYGGHRILKIEVAPSFDMKVLTLDGLHRDVLTDMHLLASVQPVKPPKNGTERTRKQRTPFYYQMLGSKNTTKKTLEESTLPEDWRQQGITRKQLTPSRKKKKKD